MMKRYLLLVFVFLTSWKSVSAQIICIFCYNQNDSISIGVNNLLLNGGFEDNTCIPWPMSDNYCPNASGYSCDIANWTCINGANSTYTYMFDGTTSTIPEGTEAAYFGNSFARACSPIQNDTTCLVTLGCTVTGVPVDFPKNVASYGGMNGVSLEQTVTGLIPGSVYVLEFWTGGESSSAFPVDGLFAVDVGFGDTLLRCPATSPGDIGRVFIVEFIASSPSHTIRFTNWGHICSFCTELVLDNVRLYTLAEISPIVPTCAGIPPSSSFSASDTILCEKFCIDFFDQSQNYPTAWEWNFPGGNPSTSTVQNPADVCYDLPGTYDVTLITTGANGNDTLIVPNYITVYATPPFPVITQNGNTLTSSPSSFYQWQLNATDIPGATNQSYTVTQSGFYTVVVTDDHGCVNSASVDILISGAAELTVNENISVFPNPSAGSFNLYISSENIPELVKINIFNTIAQNIYEMEDVIRTPDYFKEINLVNQPPGIYLLEAVSGNNYLKCKIIVE